MSGWTTDRSALLSILLDGVTGNEETVAIRQDYCRLHDIITSNFGKQGKGFLTGSKAEGISLPGSDIDVMLNVNEALKIIVVQLLNDVPVNCPNLTSQLLLCTENAKAGFAFLRFVDQPTQILHPCLMQSLQIMNGVKYLSSDLYMKNRLLFTNLSPHFGKLVRNRQGPSIEHWTGYESKNDPSTDFVDCIHCTFWPNDAVEWIRRPRHIGWPKTNDISFIVDFGCHLVPVGHPNSETKALEWRISFSVAERTLVWSFNHVQIQCYAVMKLILKEFIKEKCSEQNQVLCSYFIKTFLFWKYETTNIDFWCKNNFRECIKYLLIEFAKMYTRRCY